jgi:hypothetical protein
MGNPLHYSLELPQRCLQLIDELWPFAEKTQQPGRPDLGPLTTTFLISMSMPIINLPIERMERCRHGQSYANDRPIDPAVAKAVDNMLGGQKLLKTHFYFPGAWSFAKASPHINISQPIPDNLADELSSNKAATRASNMPTSEWCSILRNALAHGGVAYLDKDGRSSYGTPVKMYAFVSGKYEGKEKTELVHLNILRISEADYRQFLHKWVDWLKSSGLGQLAA